MKKIEIEKMGDIQGGVSSRDCWLAGVGLVFTTGLVGYYMGWLQSNWNTVTQCFE